VNKTVIIVAGGSGTRMQASVPKQFLLIDGRPILMHTIEKFQAAMPELLLIVVLPDEHLITWKALCSEHSFDVPHQVVSGGETRFHSVKNGLSAVNSGLVAVHDGVRPLVSKDTIHRCFEEAARAGAAIPVVPSSESVRMVANFSSKALDRSTIRMVQTPQCFRYEWMKEAFEQDYRESFTDCASVVEAAGFSVSLVEGNPENIKITHPADLALASWVIAQKG
jgi:2-C-methyl-D-erythritol 4-phosphate cytidylyltransferase